MQFCEQQFLSVLLACPRWLSLLLNFRDVHLVLLEPCCQSGTFQPTHHGLHPVFTTPSMGIASSSSIPLHTPFVCVPSSLIRVSYSLFLHGPFLSQPILLMRSFLSSVQSYYYMEDFCVTIITTCYLCLLTDCVTCELWTQGSCFMNYCCTSNALISAIQQ